MKVAEEQEKREKEERERQRKEEEEQKRREAEEAARIAEEKKRAAEEAEKAAEAERVAEEARRAADVAPPLSMDWAERLKAAAEDELREAGMRSGSEQPRASGSKDSDAVVEGPCVICLKNKRECVRPA